MHILSFEKPVRFRAKAESMRAQLVARDITWTALTFTSGFGSFGKLWDLSRMYLLGLALAFVYRLNLVHARGHLAAMVGLLIKRFLGGRLLFDFRGLWVDERVDKGGWDLSRRSHSLQYAYYKRVERRLLSQADHVVVLSKAVVSEVIRLGAGSLEKITVIPCCADFDHFLLSDTVKKQVARRNAGIPDQALVFGYLGSVGRMYLLERFFRLFELACEQRADVYAYVITPDEAALRDLVVRQLPKVFHERVVFTMANRREIPMLAPAMDVLVSFIQPSYARVAASPTKLAECFAMGIPTISNPGVGDVAELVARLAAGELVDPTRDDELINVLKRIDHIKSMGGARLREAARIELGLELAIERYLSVYQKVKPC